MRVSVALLAGSIAAVAFGACDEHDPVIVGHSGGAPNVDGGDSSGRTDPVPWCDVFAVLSCKCQRCHTDPPENGAPFPLLAYEHTQAEYGGGQVWQALRGAIASDFMPPSFLPELMPPVEKLTDFEKATLIGWADQGATLLGSADCVAPPPESCPKVPSNGAGGQGGADSGGAGGT